MHGADSMNFNGIKIETIEETIAAIVQNLKCNDVAFEEKSDPSVINSTGEVEPQKPQKVYYKRDNGSSLSLRANFMASLNSTSESFHTSGNLWNSDDFFAL